jgi:hypothetical protein
MICRADDAVVKKGSIYKQNVHRNNITFNYELLLLSRIFLDLIPNPITKKLQSLNNLEPFSFVKIHKNFISWQSVLLVEETGVPRENRPVASHGQTLFESQVNI